MTNTRTLSSVGTISLGVLRPTNISSPTNVMIDMKMEKSLMSFRIWTFKDIMQATKKGFMEILVSIRYSLAFYIKIYYIKIYINLNIKH